MDRVRTCERRACWILSVANPAEGGSWASAAGRQQITTNGQAKEQPKAKVSCGTIPMLRYAHVRHIRITGFDISLGSVDSGVPHSHRTQRKLLNEPSVVTPTTIRFKILALCLEHESLNWACVVCGVKRRPHNVSGEKHSNDFVSFVRCFDLCVHDPHNTFQFRRMLRWEYI